MTEDNAHEAWMRSISPGYRDWHERGYRSESLIFEGKVLLRSSPVKYEGGPPICEACSQEINSRQGLFLTGEVVNPMIHEREVAKWRMGTENKLFRKEDEALLAQKEPDATAPISIWLHDYICLARFLRDKDKSVY